MITIDTMNEIFTETQTDMQQIINAVKEEFNRPETDREAVKIWLQMPLVLKEALTAKHPTLARSLDKKAQKLREGE